MAINGDICIYRLTTATDTESSITDKIEMGGTATIPDNRTGVESFMPVMTRTITDNPAPFQELARKPDTGFRGIRCTFRLWFNEQDGNQAGAIKRLFNWYLDPNAISSIFRDGRFGIRNNFRPEFNLVPSPTYGYKLSHFELTHELKFQGLIPGTVVLELSGTPPKVV